MTWRLHNSERPTDYPIVYDSDDKKFRPESNRFNRPQPTAPSGQPIEIEDSFKNLTSVDGRSGRRIITINGEFPGPVIRVRHGSMVKITIYNDMPYQVTNDFVKLTSRCWAVTFPLQTAFNLGHCCSPVSVGPKLRASPADTEFTC